MAHPTHDVIVIGEGVSGLTAAGELARAGLKAATFESQLFGGLVLNVNELDPAPEGATTSGAELASGMMEKNAEAGVASIQEPVTLIRRVGEAFEVVTEAGTHSARAIVVASGGRLKRLGVPGEIDFEGRGVSQCADCDGPMYQNEVALVVGGGDSALQEAIVLSQYCSKVILVHRGDRFSGAAHFADHVQANEKIEIVWNATVVGIVGAQTVEKAQLKHADGRSEELPCAGVFAYIGLQPSVDFLPPEVELDANGAIRTRDNFETTAPGIYAIGAVRSGYEGTLTAAMAEARRAAQAIAARLKPD